MDAGQGGEEVVSDTKSLSSLLNRLGLKKSPQPTTSEGLLSHFFAVLFSIQRKFVMHSEFRFVPPPLLPLTFRGKP